jgi:hypothetical protein
MKLIEWETMFWETSIPLHQHLEHKTQILQTSSYLLEHNNPTTQMPLLTIILQLAIDIEIGTMFANVME